MPLAPAPQITEYLNACPATSVAKRPREAPIFIDVTPPPLDGVAFPRIDSPALLAASFTVWWTLNTKDDEIAMLRAQLQPHAANDDDEAAAGPARAAPQNGRPRRPSDFGGALMRDMVEATPPASPMVEAPSAPLASLVVGGHCRIHALLSKPELNGRVVAIVAHDAGSGRYTVRVPNTGMYKLKPANLEPAEPVPAPTAAAPAGPPPEPVLASPSPARRTSGPVIEDESDEDE